MSDAKEVASQIDAEMQALPVQHTANMRAIRRQHSKRLKQADPDHVLAVARELCEWALRELVVHDPEAVRTFLEENEEVLAARVKREVRNKLATGLKNPRQKGE